LILLVSLSRWLSAFFFGDVIQLPRFIAGVAVALPYCIVYWIFSLMIFQWAAIFHYSMSLREDHFTKVQPFFIGSNILVTLIVLLLFLAIVSEALDPYIFALTGSITLSFISILSGVAFLIYGNLLARDLGKASVSGSKSKSEFCCDITLSTKMMLTGVCIGILFILESVMWLLSILDEGTSGNGVRRTNAYTAAFYGVDILMLSIILLVFRASVDRQVKGHEKTRKSTGKGEKGSTASHFKDIELAGSQADLPRSESNVPRSESNIPRSDSSIHLSRSPSNMQRQDSSPDPEDEETWVA